VYLDDHPAIAQIYDMTSAPIIIAVPYFLAAGSHTTLDVPRALGLNTLDRPQTIRGRSVFYTDPVGTEDGLREAILALARDAGLTQMQTDSSVSSDNWGCFPMMGRDVFLEAVYGTSAGLRFGELLLTREEVRVYGDDIAQRVITTPGELRAAVRESPFRSLATARGLKGGWRVPIRHSSMLHAVVETIYPGLVAEWAAQRSGTFTPRPLHDTLERQQGDYRAIIGIDAETESAVTNNVCGGCVRAPTWRSASGDLPCLEACNHWLSAALQITEAESDHS
jgi:sirohydrochlorin cobaltochelatase